MCNFYGHKVSTLQFIKLKQIEKQLGIITTLNQFEKLKNGFNYSNSVIVKKQGINDIEAIIAKWEFTPSWIEDEDDLKLARKQGIPWLNARSETILESKMFRDAALNNRCLIPASYFFEWRSYKPNGTKKEEKYPYLIGVNKEDYFYFAGIYNNWLNKSTGESIYTFALITTKANELMEAIHNSKKRMPTILPQNQAYEWLMDDLTEPQIQELASYQINSKNMYAYTIPKNFKLIDDPTLKFEYEDLAPLSFSLK